LGSSERLGTRDRNPVQMKVLEDVFGTIVQCFKRHDAVTIDTPVFELKVWKYSQANTEKTQNLYTTSRTREERKVYRRDQPAMTRGRYREFYQCDFDIAGDYGPMLADVECIRIIYEILSELALGDFVIKINHRRLLDGLFKACNVPAEKFTATCSAVDKLDKSPWEAVQRELLEEKGLNPDTVDKIGQYVQLNGTLGLVDRLEADEPLMQQETAREALTDIRLLLSYCEALGILERVRFDLSLARGLDYYTGVIYEAVLTGMSTGPLTKVLYFVSIPCYQIISVAKQLCKC
uniref:AA_TRNA_LIGASE_II domain-containing protein n=1 Tax=Echinostoma caproni TaxID=27848 RepID=A0A183B3P5_9TREM